MTPPPFTPDMALVFAVIGVTVVLFLTEWLRVDVVAILVMVSLPMLGLISGREAFGGLASNAVVSIIAVIIMGRGLDHTGVINRLVRPLVELAGSSRQRIIVLLSGTVAVISSLMQNIGAAALFLPAIQRMSRSTGIPVAKLLMPVGFSAILGGTVTLVGSSPLIMLNDLLRPYDLAPFSLFSVTPVGVALVVAGILYFLLLSRWVLPRSKEDAAAPRSDDPLAYYPELGRMYEIKAEAGPTEPPLVMNLYDGFGVHVVALTLPGGTDTLVPPDRDLRIPEGSVFAVYGPPGAVQQMAEKFGFTVREQIRSFQDILSPEMSGVVEAVVPPHSSFLGKELGQVRFRHTHRMAPLALSHEERTDYSGIQGHVLAVGDTILMFGTWDAFNAMRHKRDLLFVQSPDHEILVPNKALMAVGCFALATALVVFTDLTLAVCLMTGALGMILTRVLDIDEAYRAVDWRTVFLLAGLIPLGLALEQTRAAPWLAVHILDLLGTPAPLVFLFVVGLISTVITLLVSNVGATVLLVPLVVDMAGEIGTDPRLAALVVGLAASNSFILPTHQVNALYMGPGGYTSRDFVKAGIPMSLVFLAVMTAVIGLLY